MGVLLPVSAFALAAIAVATAGLLWSTWQNDRFSIQREVQATQAAIDRNIQEVARAQEIVILGDEPVERLRAQDWTWYDRNVGARLFESFGHDQIFILDPTGQPVYAMIGGVRVAPGAFEKVRPEIGRMIDVVRGRIREPNHRHDRNPGQQKREEGWLLTTDAAVHDTHLLRVQGRPATVSVMLVDPLATASHTRGATQPVLISIKDLDADLFGTLNGSLLANPRFSASGEVKPGERALILKSEYGEAIGYFIWTPEFAGTKVLAYLGPVLAVSSLAMLLLLGLLARSLGRSFSELRREIVVREEAEARAEMLARHDSLTGLLNRRIFAHEVEMRCSAAGRESGSRQALILIEIDSLSLTSSTFGGAAADELLLRTAERITKLSGPEALVGRTGENQFAILTDLRSADFSFVAKLYADVREPLKTEPAILRVVASAGAAVWPTDCARPADLLPSAEAALGRAKLTSSDECVFFDAEADRSGLTAKNVAPLPRVNQMRLDLREAAVAEISIRAACESLREWPEQAGLLLSLPNSYFDDPWFAARLLAVVHSTGLSPSRLTIEIKEASLFEARDRWAGALTELNAAGVRLLLSEVSGQLSPTNWQHLSFDQIKIAVAPRSEVPPRVKAMRG